METEHENRRSDPFCKEAKSQIMNMCFLCSNSLLIELLSILASITPSLSLEKTFCKPKNYPWDLNLSKLPHYKKKKRKKERQWQKKLHIKWSVWSRTPDSLECIGTHIIHYVRVAQFCVYMESFFGPNYGSSQIQEFNNSTGSTGFELHTWAL